MENHALQLNNLGDLTMSFFTLSTGEQAKSTTTFEVQGGSIEPIPAGSILLAVITEAKWDEYQGERYINLRWDVVGKDHAGRVIFQKLKVMDSEPKKRDKAIMMLMAIDANTGGHLAKVNGEPSDQDLTKLCGRKIGIMVDVWRIKDSETGEEKSGNWIKMVSSPKDAGEKLKELGGNPKAETKPAEPKKPANVTVEEDDLDDMPF
jgi:hypothetical protein